MPNKIQVKRGLKSALPTLSAGEFGYCTDTKELFIGNATGGNTLVAVGDISTLLSGKVDKVAGKQLSTEDYTSAEKTKLAGIAAGAQPNAVTSVAGKTGAVALAKADVGLGNVDNVQQAPLTHVGTGGIAHAAATTTTAGFMSATDKSKLDGIAAGAQVNTVTSVAGKTGAVTLAKADVGLGNVENNPTATQAQAETGAVSTAFMTPLRTKQYVDQRMQNGISLRLNGGSLEYYDGSVWKPMAAVKSIQRGTASMPTSTVVLNVTISAVDITKSMIIVNGRAPSSIAGVGAFTGNLTSATNLELRRGGGDNTGDAVWQVVEYF